MARSLGRENNQGIAYGMNDLTGVTFCGEWRVKKLPFSICLVLISETLISHYVGTDVNYLKEVN